MAFAAVAARPRRLSTFCPMPTQVIVPRAGQCSQLWFCRSGHATTVGMVHQIFPHLERLYFTDHYGGLSETWEFGRIYCSEVTARLVQHMLGVQPDLVHVLPMDTPTLVEGELGSWYLSRTTIRFQQNMLRRGGDTGGRQPLPRRRSIPVPNVRRQKICSLRRYAVLQADAE